jgi:hypothetical protein
MTVVMKVADYWYIDAEICKSFDYGWNGGSGLVIVDGDTHELGTRSGEGGHLGDGAGNVGRIGIGHGLNHDRMV